MQEEVSKKSVAFTVNATKFTADVLYKAIKAFLEHRTNNKATNHGKMKVKELVGQGKGTSIIEINDNNINDFIRVAKKYNVDFAVKRDNTFKSPDGKNKYLIFFKGHDADVLTQAFKEYVKVVEKKRDRLSMKEKLNKAKEKAAQHNREHQKEKTKQREETL